MKIGDRLVCIENKNHNIQLTIGKSYKITRLTDDYIYILDNHYFEGGWFYSQFVTEIEYYRRLKIEKIKRCINQVTE